MDDRNVEARENTLFHDLSIAKLVLGAPGKYHQADKPMLNLTDAFVTPMEWLTNTKRK